MTDNKKAEQILYALMRICPSRNVVLLQADDVLKKCGSAEELNFFYQKLYGGNNYGTV